MKLLTAIAVSGLALAMTSGVQAKEHRDSNRAHGNDRHHQQQDRHYDKSHGRRHHDSRRHYKKHGRDHRRGKHHDNDYYYIGAGLLLGSVLNHGYHDSYGHNGYSLLYHQGGRHHYNKHRGHNRHHGH